MINLRHPRMGAVFPMRVITSLLCRANTSLLCSMGSKMMKFSIEIEYLAEGKADLWCQEEIFEMKATGKSSVEAAIIALRSFENQHPRAVLHNIHIGPGVPDV